MSLSWAGFTFEQNAEKKKIGPPSKMLSQVAVKVAAIDVGVAGSP